MILIARNQQDGMRVAVWKNALSGNLSSIIDVDGVYNGYVRAKRNERVQVEHRTALLPKEPVQVSASSGKRKRTTDDLTLRINTCCFALRISSNGPEVTHHSIPPEKRMDVLVI
jgi:hypothetical protein